MIEEEMDKELKGIGAEALAPEEIRNGFGLLALGGIRVEFIMEELEGGVLAGKFQKGVFSKSEAAHAGGRYPLEFGVAGVAVAENESFDRAKMRQHLLIV